MPRAAQALAFLAACMGAAGVALAALAAHQGGVFAGLASQFLILHAAALLGVSAHARQSRGRALLAAGAALALGATLFSADLAARDYFGGRLFPFAAPTGGSLMILAWLALAIAFAVGAARIERAR